MNDPKFSGRYFTELIKVKDSEKTTKIDTVSNRPVKQRNYSKKRYIMYNFK